MICKNCGFDIPENDRFCNNCGAEVKAEATVNTPNENNQGYDNNAGYGYYSSNQGGYYGNQQNNGGYYAGNPAGNQGYWTPPVNDKAPGVKDYLKWMLLYPLWNFIPGIGFIIYIVLCIKYALDNTYTARANFFKATLISMVIGIGIAVLMVIAMLFLFGTATAVSFSVLEEMDPSFFVNEFSEAFPVLFIK